MNAASARISDTGFSVQFVQSESPHTEEPAEGADHADGGTAIGARAAERLRRHRNGRQEEKESHRTDDHGKVRRRTFPSTRRKSIRRMHVLLPESNEPGPERNDHDRDAAVPLLATPADIRASG